jgi:hypothetical protein
MLCIIVHEGKLRDIIAMVVHGPIDFKNLKYP